MNHFLSAFRHSTGFVITIVLTLALGIGANTAIFSLVHAVLLRSLPVRDPKMLLRVGSDAGHAGIMGGLPSNDNFSLFSFDLYEHLKRTSSAAFEQLAAVQSGGEGLSVRAGGQIGKSQQTEYVSGNYFQTLGIGSFAGRMLTSQDDAPSAPAAAVMSYNAWQANFGSDPGVVGKTFTFDNHPITIVGIAPSGFFGDRVSPTPPAFWLPLSLEPLLEGSYSILRSPTSNWLYLLGRAKPGVNTKALGAEMTGTLRNWLLTQPTYTRNGGATIIARQHIEIVPGGGGIQQLQQQQSKGLYLLMAISALVLLVACANVANLRLAWDSAHRADTSLRIALGAPRARLIRQMLAESVVLSCLGGLAGLALAYAGSKMILSLAFPDAPQLPIHPEPSLPVLGFAFLLSLITGVIFGAVPAWLTSRADPSDALRAGKRVTPDRVSFSQRSLIVLQSALSLILLVGAGLLTRSLAHLEDQDFGIQTTNRYVAHIDPAGAGYSVSNLPNLYRQIQQRFESTSGVASVGLALYSPLEQDEWNTGISVEGRPEPRSGANGSVADFDRVSPQFFTAVGERLVRGRVFTDDDTAASQGVAVINETFARHFFPGQNPIGQYFGSYRSHANAHKIVGVVADAKFVEPTAKPNAMYFLPLNQRVAGIDADQAASESRGLYLGAIVLQFKSQPYKVDELVRRTLGEIDPNLTVNDLHSLEFQVNGNFTENRLISRLATLFGLLALVLATVGLYGITSYEVTQQTREIGLRMALGATRGKVLLMVLRGALLQVGIGLALGVPIALVAAESIKSQLYGVKSNDPTSLLLAIGALALSATIAGLIPARRAITIEPMTALRIE